MRTAIRHLFLCIALIWPALSWADDVNISPGGGDYLIDSDVSVRGDTPLEPDPLGPCGCDENNNPVDWLFAGSLTSFSGDIDDDGVITSATGRKNVYAHVTYGWSCPADSTTNLTEGQDDAQAAFDIYEAGFEGPSEVYIESEATFNAKKMPNDVAVSASWEADGGTPGTGSGTSFTAQWATPGEHAISATIEGAQYTHTVKVKPPEITVVELTFKSDHGVLRDNNADWTNAGNVYQEPEWTSSRNNPISHTKNQNVQVALKVHVEPSALPERTYVIDGNGTIGCNFEEQVGLSGGDNIVTMTSQDKLPDQVAYSNSNISWTIKLSNTVVGYTQTGPHKLYVTFGMPGGVVATEMRMAWVVAAASGKAAKGDCADAVFASLSGITFNLQGDLWGPSPVWLLHNGSPYKSQCPGLAKYVNEHFQMLGLGAGVYRFCHATADGGYTPDEEMDQTTRFISQTQGHPSPTAHDDINIKESLCHWDGNGNPNNFEAACLFNAKFYALGVGKFDDAKGVVKQAFTINNELRVSWEYIKVTNVGPPEKLDFATCSDVPWVEAQ